MAQAYYRSRQFFAAVWVMWFAHPVDASTDLLAHILTTPAQRHRFNQMPPNDQRHGFAVARMLYEANYRDQALLQAGLLHDMGKSLGQPLIHRVLIVLLEAFWPTLLLHVSTGPTDAAAIQQLPWWRRPFVIHAHHPTIGATWAETAHCHPRAVWLIAHHQDALPIIATHQDYQLALLQWADNAN